MSVEGITAIAAIISAVAAAASAAYSMSQGGGSTKTPTLPGIPKTQVAADSATSGLMRSEMMGGATPAWRSGLTGNLPNTGPMPGAGSASATPIGGPSPTPTGMPDLSSMQQLTGGGQGGIPGLSDEAAGVFSKFLKS